jgi:hypothetical protein
MKAFPTPTFSINDEARVTAVGGEGGMDLRDYFAAKALNSILGQYDFTFFIDDEMKKQGETFAFSVAKDAYEIADAMMEARKSDSSIK